MPATFRFPGHPGPHPLPGTVDLAIVGAGAAGIAAARRALRAGLRVALLEARDRLGGRAVTTTFGGHPVDLGAHWLHAGAVNPLVRIARLRGEPLRRAPSGGHVLIRGRPGTREERDALSRGFERYDAAITGGARTGPDRDVAALLPPLGRFGPAVAATIALVSGRLLREVSARDFPSEEFGDNHFVRGGYGAYLARLGVGLPVALGCPVERVAWSGRGATLSGFWGTLEARAAIVTVPVPVLASGAVWFDPPLPAEVAAALAGFLPGTYEHVVLNWPDIPFRGPDRLAKLVGRRRNLGMMTWMDGAPFHYLELDHETAQSHPGPEARARLAREVLAEQVGSRALRRLRVLAATDWAGDPWSRCAWAVVPPGRAADRAAIGEAIGGRLWLAGEANSRRMWGTVGGAWEEGERAAAAACRALGAEAPPC